MNFPLVSRTLSFFPLSTPIRFIFPEWVPVAMNLLSGEKPTVHVSTRKYFHESCDEKYDAPIKYKICKTWEPEIERGCQWIDTWTTINRFDLFAIFKIPNPYMTIHGARGSNYKKQFFKLVLNTSNVAWIFTCAVGIYIHRHNSQLMAF